LVSAISLKSINGEKQGIDPGILTFFWVMKKMQ
jgi:hypothetical protein